MIFNYLICFVLAVIRIAGHRSDIFKDIAHFYVAGLFSWAMCEYTFTKPINNPWKFYLATSSVKKKVFLTVIISVVEIIVAIYQRLA